MVCGSYGVRRLAAALPGLPRPLSLSQPPAHPQALDYHHPGSANVPIGILTRPPENEARPLWSAVACHRFHPGSLLPSDAPWPTDRQACPNKAAASRRTPYDPHTIRPSPPSKGNQVGCSSPRGGGRAYPRAVLMFGPKPRRAARGTLAPPPERSLAGFIRNARGSDRRVRACTHPLAARRRVMVRASTHPTQCSVLCARCEVVRRVLALRGV